MITYPIRRALARMSGPAVGQPLGETTRVWRGFFPTDLQWTEHGLLMWNLQDSGVFYPYPQVPKLAAVREFRDPIGLAGGTPGMLYRSAKLSEATPQDVLVLNYMLARGQILDLRTGGRAAKEPDPRMVGVHYNRVSLPPTVHVPYAEIIRTHRVTLREIVLRAAHHIGGPVLIHCSEGKDRTGIVVALIMLAAGYPMHVAREEFLSTVGAKPSDWDYMIAAMRWEVRGEPLRTWFTSRAGLVLTENELDLIASRFGKD